MEEEKLKFPNFKKAYLNLSNQRIENLNLIEIKKLLCSDCQFYKPDEPDELECGAFQLLKTLIEKGFLNFEQIAKAVE